MRHGIAATIALSRWENSVTDNSRWSVTEATQVTLEVMEVGGMVAQSRGRTRRLAQQVQAQLVRAAGAGRAQWGGHCCPSVAVSLWAGWSAPVQLAKRINMRRLHNMSLHPTPAHRQTGREEESAL
ncbi:hypothetical protein AAFF_G00424680 [Aldrovandia affinis]|uniref:Uncharacterized protein n=1 Tax=Aldrovandia affinis TaxID=143900 RepID=A0AAD7T7W3_9TELE|nr:hypothetical protein AAFF_G00424680 [Aldrovandia affinis]